jgi:hypothetical protein
MAKNSKIVVRGLEIVVFKNLQEDFISLTDLARHRDADAVIIYYKIG